MRRVPNIGNPVIHDLRRGTPFKKRQNVGRQRLGLAALCAIFAPTSNAVLAPVTIATLRDYAVIVQWVTIKAVGSCRPV